MSSNYRKSSARKPDSNEYIVYIFTTLNFGKVAEVPESGLGATNKTHVITNW